MYIIINHTNINIFRINIMLFTITDKLNLGICVKKIIA